MDGTIGVHSRRSGAASGYGRKSPDLQAEVRNLGFQLDSPPWLAVGL